MMKLVFLAAVPFFLAACASKPPEGFDVSGRPVPAATPGVSFAGTWTYSPEDSDQPGRGGMGGGVGARGGFGGGFGGGGRGGIGGRGGFGGRGGGGGGGGGAYPGGRGGQEGGRGDQDSTLMRPPGRLVISQTDSSLSISPRDGAAYTLFFDGRDVTVTDTARGTHLSLNGRWHGKRFEVRRTLRNGAGLVESYEITKHGQRLVVHMQVSRGEGEPAMPEFRRVYDRYGS